MIKAQQKPIEEILSFLSPYRQVLNIGCGGCTSVCLAGGQREVQAFNRSFAEVCRHHDKEIKLDGYTVERQCNHRYLQELDDLYADYDCMVSMACGAGVQLLAERYPDRPVYPLLDTTAIGVDRELAVFEERCRACGRCVIGYTGGICPVTRCAKGLFNGPCGGTYEGSCEISREIPCAWNEIYERLKSQGRLDDILKVQPPMQWQNQVPRTTVQAQYYRKPDNDAD